MAGSGGVSNLQAGGSLFRSLFKRNGKIRQWRFQTCKQADRSFDSFGTCFVYFGSKFQTCKQTGRSFDFTGDTILANIMLVSNLQAGGSLFRPSIIQDYPLLLSLRFKPASRRVALSTTAQLSSLNSEPTSFKPASRRVALSTSMAAVSACAIATFQTCKQAGRSFNLSFSVRSCCPLMRFQTCKQAGRSLRHLARARMARIA